MERSLQVVDVTLPTVLVENHSYAKEMEITSSVDGKQFRLAVNLSYMTTL